MKNVAQDLIVAADKYDMQELELVCEKYLIRHLSVENSFELFSLLNESNSKGMQRKFKQFSYDFIIVTSKDYFREVSTPKEDCQV